MVKKNILVDITIYIVFILLGMYISVFQRSLNDISASYIFLGTFKGVLITSHFAGFLIMPLVTGEISDKFGRKLMSCIGFASFFLGLVLSIVTKNIYLYIFAFSLIGGGFGVIEGLMTTILVDINKDKENIVINISQAFFVVGALLGPFLVSFFITKGYNWRHIYFIFAVFSFIYIIYFALLKFKKSRRGVGKLKGIIVLKLLKKPVLLLLALSILMYVGIEQGIGFFITTYIQKLTVSEFIPSLVLSGFWGFMIIGRLSCGFLSRRFDSKKIIIILALFSGISLLFIIFAKGYILTGIGFSLLGLGFSGIWPLIVFLASKNYRIYSGTAVGIMMASSALGGMIIPFLSETAGSSFGINIGIASFLIPVIAIIIAQFAIIRIKAKKIDS